MSVIEISKHWIHILFRVSLAKYLDWFLNLTMHSTHFIYGYMVLDIMVEDQSDSKRGNLLLLLHGLLFLISSKGYFICTIPHRIVYTMAFVIPVVEHWLE